VDWVILDLAIMHGPPKLKDGNSEISYLLFEDLSMASEIHLLIEVVVVILLSVKELEFEYGRKVNDLDLD
jgi:hypothetical protein